MQTCSVVMKAGGDIHVLALLLVLQNMYFGSNNLSSHMLCGSTRSQIDQVPTCSLVTEAALATCKL